MNILDPSVLIDDLLLSRVWEAMGRPPGCRVTGGYVRDRLLGRPSTDLDLTLDGDVDDAAGPARRLAAACGVRAHLLGTAPHRIWRIETPSLEIEIWPLGELSPEADIRRRDFSCNALSRLLPDGPLVDLVGGLGDIRYGRLRAVSRENLASDPVRLLRGPRFLAQLADFDLDDRTRGWIRELAPALTGAPRERVGQELLKLLRGPAASRGLAECLDLGLFESAAPHSRQVDSRWLVENLGGADRLGARGRAGETPAPQLSDDHRAAEVPREPQQALDDLGVSVAREPPQGEGHCGAGVPPAGSRSGTGGDAARLALLFRAWGLPTDRELAPYAWPRPVRETGSRAARLLDDALATVGGPFADRRELAWRAGSAFPALIDLAAACAPDVQGWTRWRRQWRRNPKTLVDPKPLLSGNEIAALAGIDPGPALGAVADALLKAQIRGEIRSRGGAVRWLRRGHRSGR